MFHPKFQCFVLQYTLTLKVHPGRLKRNLQITHLERRMIFRTSMIMFHVNLQGCKSKENLFEIQQCHIFCWRRLATCRRRPWPCQTSGGRQSCQGLSDLRLNFYIISLHGTLPETNWILKIGHPKRKVVFQPSIFRWYVGVREGIPLLKLELHLLYQQIVACLWMLLVHLLSYADRPLPSGRYQLKGFVG